jgi:hypothetical protein
MGTSLKEMQGKQAISAGRDNFKQLTANLQAAGLAVRWVAVPAARAGERHPMYAGGDRCYEWSCYNASKLADLMLNEYEAIDLVPRQFDFALHSLSKPRQGKERADLSEYEAIDRTPREVATRASAAGNTRLRQGKQQQLVLSEYEAIDRPPREFGFQSNTSIAKLRQGKERPSRGSIEGPLVPSLGPAHSRHPHAVTGAELNHTRMRDTRRQQPLHLQRMIGSVLNHTRIRDMRRSRNGIAKGNRTA